MSRSVTVTIPINITISLGTPILSQPVKPAVHYASRITSGINRNKGWQGICNYCGCNRWLGLVYVDATDKLAAYCNVCNSMQEPPQPDYSWAFVEPKVFEEQLARAQSYPPESFPVLVATL
jgi:hypothetical protein